LLRYFKFHIWGHLPLEVIFNVWFGHISLNLKFWEDPTCGCWDISILKFMVIFHWRSSSFEPFVNLGLDTKAQVLNYDKSLVWSHKLKSKISGRSDLLIFEGVFHWRLSSIGGHLPLEVIFIWNICKVWLAHMRLSIKFGDDPTNCCRDMKL
jgi:hypothetical protein